MPKAALLLLLLGGCAVAERTPSAKALLVLDSALAGDRDLDRELQRYVKLVRSRCGYDVVVVPERKDLPPDKLRDLLETRQKKDSIRGAFLVGNFRMKKFKGASGDLGMFPEYYQDFDGEMRDENGDGVLDYYDPWTGRDGAVPLKIWLALLRPYDTNVAGEPGVVDLVRYFAKINGEMERETRTAGDATVFTTKDWDPADLVDALKPVFRDVKRVDGRSPDDFGRAAGIPSEILLMYVHSGPAQHSLDSPAYPKNLILPGEMDYPGRRLLEEFQVNAKLVGLLFCCHGLDVGESRYLNGRFLANSYVLNPDYPTQSVIGSAKSIGLTALGDLVKGLGGGPFCEGWLKYQNRAYEQGIFREWKQVWEHERYRFNWSYVLYGNPFVRIRARENVIAGAGP